MAILGIDAGGTKTVCRVADDEGVVLAESRGPGANLHNAGELHVEKVLHEVIQSATAEADVWPRAACIGIAGVDRPDDADIVRGILTRLIPRCHLTIVNDALIALEAGAPGQPGVVVIAGTGSIAYGRDGHGRAARAGGWGYVLADEGSGYWLGRQVLRAVLRAADGRGPQTPLTPRVLAHYEVNRPHDLVREVYAGRFKPATVAAIAGLVEVAAVEGDVWAKGLIETAADELSLAGLSVVKQLGLLEGPLVLAGGIFGAVPRLGEAVRARFGEALPNARVTRLEQEPVDGAINLARAALRGTLVIPSYGDTAP